MDAPEAVRGACMIVRCFVFFAAIVASAFAGFAAAAAESSVTISQGVDPVTMDPLKRTITPTTNAQLQMFDTLLRRDREGNYSLSLRHRTGASHRPYGNLSFVKM